MTHHSSLLVFLALPLYLSIFLYYWSSNKVYSLSFLLTLTLSLTLILLYNDPP